MTETEEYKEAFCLFDSKGKGQIIPQEIISAMQILGENLTESDLEEILKEADMDSNGKISWEEFKQMMF